MKTFTKEFMRSNCGCYSQEKLMATSFMQSNEITLESIFKSEIPLKDKFWFYCKKVATKYQNRKIAIDVAEIVLPIFESKFPNDLRPREAIQAAKQFISGHITIEQIIEKKNDAAAAADAAYATAYAADAAYATAYAADAAYATAYAAYAAYATAYAAYAAAADAAYAAADAADAAYAAAADAAYAAYADDDIKQKLEQYLYSLV